MDSYHSSRRQDPSRCIRSARETYIFICFGLARAEEALVCRLLDRKRASYIVQRRIDHLWLSTLIVRVIALMLISPTIRLARLRGRASCARSEAPLKLGGGSAVPGTVSSADSEPDQFKYADLVGTIDALVVQWSTVLAFRCGLTLSLRRILLHWFLIGARSKKLDILD